MSAMPVTAPAPAAALRQVALPVEHGGWGLLAEPALLGLLLLPTGPGFALAGAALFAFLARHPARLALADRLRGTRHPRTALAERVAGGYGLLALGAAALAASAAPALTWVLAAPAATLALVQLAYDVRLQGRRLAPELAGGIALGGLAAVIVAGGGGPLRLALAAWALLALRAVTSVLYVRARLRLERGAPADTVAALGAHFAALALASALALGGWAPWLAPLAFALLLARASHGLGPARRPARPRTVGFQEMAYGIVTTAALAGGWALGL